jgi:hypothetical protein
MNHHLLGLTTFNMQAGVTTLNRKLADVATVDQLQKLADFVNGKGAGTAVLFVCHMIVVTPPIMIVTIAIGHYTTQGSIIARGLLLG